MKALFKLVLKCSVAGGMAALTAAAGCSDTSKGDTTGAAGTGDTTTGGSSSKAGAPGSGGDDTTTVTKGGASEGGASNGGAAEITSPGGGGPDFPVAMGGDNAGGAGTGPAVAKFCNSLTFGNAPTTMILEVGDGAKKVTFTAVSGECVPADGDACTEIPIGRDVTIQMFDGDDPSTALDSGSANIKAGQDWIFWTDVDTSGAQPQPVFGGGVSTQVACEDITYGDVNP